MKHSKALSAALLAASLTTITASGAPARPGLRLMTQPDGTTVILRMLGDEYLHFYATPEGVPVTEKDGYFYITALDAEGNPVASDIRADMSATRSATPDTTEARGVVDALARKRDANRLLRHEMTAPPSTRGIGLQDEANRYPAFGNSPGIVILVEFEDTKFTTKYVYDYFDRMLNEKGFGDNGATGSARDYFEDNSCGVFTPQFDLYGPVTVSKGYAYYGANDRNGFDEKAWEMIAEACTLIDKDVDFSQYDCNHDGRIDNVYVFYAGPGEASYSKTPDPELIWPHSWSVPWSAEKKYDGVRLYNYACSNELEYGQPDGIGTFVHEFSHVLGLPDLYATASTTNFTPNDWSVLDMGCYLNASRTPPYYSSFERNALDWMELTEISEPCRMTLHPIDTNTAAVLRTDSKEEFFLFENRQRTGWDKYLPGHGMLVWHIDYDKSAWWQNAVNNENGHPRVDIIEADRRVTEKSLAGDSFPGTADVHDFTMETHPSYKSWNGTDLETPITDIVEKDGLISFDVKGGDSGVGILLPDGIAMETCGLLITASGLLPGTAVTVYDLSGRAVASAVPSDSTATLTAPAHGLYIVAVTGMRPVKIML